MFFMVCLENVPFIIMLTTGSCAIVLLLWKKKIMFWNVIFLVKVIKFLWRGFLFLERLCTVQESARQNFMQHMLLEPGTVYGKVGLWTVNSFPIQSSKFIHFVSPGTMLALFWSFLVLMGGKADGQDFFLTKSIGFSSVQLHALECMIQSTNI